MLYFRALLDGLDAMPAIDPEIRTALRVRLSVEGVERLHDELRGVDPASAQRIHPNDPQRILRALEVYRSTGRPLASFQSGSVGTVPSHWRLFTLWPEDREGLRQRIADRFDLMLAGGLAGELLALKERPALTAGHTSQRAVGYRQGWQWLSGEIGPERFRELAITATRQLAKRQLTWLRGMQGRGLEYLPAERARVEDLLGGG